MARKKRFNISEKLSESLSQTVQMVDEHAGNLRFEIVPIAKIEIDPLNPRELLLNPQDLPEGPDSSDPYFERKVKEKNQLQSLAEAIKQKGIINPVWVYKNGTHYRIAAGERRVLASIMAGKSDIPAKILDYRPRGVDLRLIQWMENVERIDLSLWERLNNLRLIIDEYLKQHTEVTLSPTLIKNLINCSLPHAVNYYTVLKAREEIQQAIHKGTIKNLEKAAFLSGVQDEALFFTTLQACINGASLKQLQSMIATRKRHDTIKQRDKRGRKASRISLGYTSNVKIVRMLVEFILKNTDKNTFDMSTINWNDLSSVSKTFQKLILSFEEHVI